MEEQQDRDVARGPVRRVSVAEAAGPEAAADLAEAPDAGAGSADPGFALGVIDVSGAPDSNSASETDSASRHARLTEDPGHATDLVDLTNEAAALEAVETRSSAVVAPVAEIPARSREAATGRSFTLEHSNFIKGLAYLWMVACHLYRDPAIYRFAQLDLLGIPERVLNHFSYTGYLCVPLFIFVSGYGLTLSHDRTSPPARAYWPMVKRRLLKFERRILLFTVPVILYHLVFQQAWADYRTDQPFDGAVNVVLDALGLSHFFGQHLGNGSWWYLSTYIFLIFFAPVILDLSERYAPALLFFAFSFLARYHVPMFGISLTPFGACSVFLMGSVFARRNVFERLDAWLYSLQKPLRLLYRLILLFLFYDLAVFRYLVTEHEYWELFYLLLPALLILICYELARISWLRKALAFVGKCSLGAYLTHTEFRVFALLNGRNVLDVYLINAGLGFLVGLAGCLLVEAVDRRRRRKLAPAAPARA